MIVGDSDVTPELSNIKADILLLPIGGHYTMDIENSIIAAQWINSEQIIPMHYNTFEAIKVNLEDFERQIRDKGKISMVMKIGEILGG